MNQIWITSGGNGEFTSYDGGLKIPRLLVRINAGEIREERGKMTSEETPLTTKEDLNAELQALLRRAYENGLNVEGGFECRNGVEHPDWDVVVTEVEKNAESK